VAVAGQIKRGKSTLVNAVLGQRVSATGRLETTLNICELRYGTQPGITVHYRDDRPAEQIAAEVWENSTTRGSGPSAAEVARVEIALPAPLLRRLRIVDTPGLGSVYGTESRDTADFLGIDELGDEASRSALTGLLTASGRSARAVHEESAAQVAAADAALFVFSRALHERERLAVDAFTGPAVESVNPLTSITVLSRCDEYWSAADGAGARPSDPMAEARAIAARHRERVEVSRLFSTVLPVAGLVAEGAETVPSEAFNWLSELERGFGSTLTRALRDANWFGNAEALAGIALPAEQRRVLIERLGAWGVFRACELLHDGLDEQAVRDRLVEDSGVARLRELLVNRLGNRAALIKLDRVLRRAGAEITRCRVAAGSAALERVADRLGQLRLRSHGFAELGVLARYAEGALHTEFTAAELDQILHVTGEYGTDAAARVALPADSGARSIEQAAAALVRAWLDRSRDPGLSRPAADAARVALRGYERIHERAGAARLLLENVDDAALDAPFGGDRL